MTTTASGITNSPFIGLSNFHVAKMITDPDNGEATYGEVISIPHIRGIDIKPTSASATLYADDQAVDTASVTSEYDLTIDVATLPLEYKALLLGHEISDGVMVANKSDVAPYFAIAFETAKRNGKKRFCKYFKVQFAEPEEKPATKAENIQYNTPILTGKAIYRTSDGNSYKQGDEEAGLSGEAAAAWYATV